MVKRRFLGIVCLFCWSVVPLGCKPEKKYHDQNPGKAEHATTDALAEILKFQDGLNEKFKDPETSPLPDRFRKDFDGLDFFGPDTNYVVKARFMATPDAVPFMMPTTTDRKSREVVYGIAEFFLKGKKHSLEIYQSVEPVREEGYEDYLFLPFTDLTNGGETYAGGRYIDLRIADTDDLTIDFNRAYNPYCAYNPKYSCPIVPRVNDLGIEILAGVKDFKKDAKK